MCAAVRVCLTWFTGFVVENCDFRLCACAALGRLECTWIEWSDLQGFQCPCSSSEVQETVLDDLLQRLGEAWGPMMRALQTTVLGIRESFLFFLFGGFWSDVEEHLSEQRKQPRE